MAEPFIGEIRMFPYPFAPRNWAFCDGQTVDIMQNVMLYSILGITYGGDGQTSFALPDLKGRAPMHYGQGPGLYAKWIGEKGGYATMPLNEAQMPAHTHAISVTKSNAASADPGGLYPSKYVEGADKTNLYKDNPTLDATFSNSAMANAGNSYPHENRQPWLVIPFCIAMDGIYPARS